MGSKDVKYPHKINRKLTAKFSKEEFLEVFTGAKKNTLSFEAPNERMLLVSVHRIDLLQDSNVRSYHLFDIYCHAVDTNNALGLKELFRERIYLKISGLNTDTKEVRRVEIISTV